MYQLCQAEWPAASASGGNAAGLRVRVYIFVIGSHAMGGLLVYHSISVALCDGNFPSAGAECIGLVLPCIASHQYGTLCLYSGLARKT